MIKIEIKYKESEESFYIEQECAEKTLLTLCRENHIYLDALCAGNGACGKCRVQFLKGAPKPTEKERRILTTEEQQKGIRLACCTIPKEDCEICLPKYHREKINALNLQEIQSDSRVVCIHEQDKTCRYGIAIDIGTTTIAAVLVDMENGNTIAAETSVNHQRSYGADVISRIQAANEGKGDLLQESIRDDITMLIDRMINQAEAAVSQIEKICIVGNTTMCHLLRGLSCTGLGAAPFVPTDISFYETSAKNIFGWENDQAKVVILPGISAFVGADVVAGIYANHMQESTQERLLLDIGTNGEMVLGNKNGFLVTSAAAGPVFEGGNIACGVPGIPGAVAHATLSCGTKSKDLPGTERTITSRYETIGEQPPVGICGSGIIDVMSELVRLGIVDENGTMAEEWFEEGVPVAGEEVVFTQRDVREIQMGKSAIRAGIETLLAEYKKMRVKIKDADMDGVPEEVLLAGGFGYYMDADKAINIGLFPNSFKGRIRPVGNSALEGARRYLLAEEAVAKRQIQQMINCAQEINLAMHPTFQELYLQHMFFEQRKGEGNGTKE